MKREISFALLPLIFSGVSFVAETFIQSFKLSETVPHQFDLKHPISANLLLIFQQIRIITLNCYQSPINFTMAMILITSFAALFAYFFQRNASKNTQKSLFNFGEDKEFQPNSRALAFASTIVKFIDFSLCYCFLSIAFSHFLQVNNPRN